MWGRAEGAACRGQRRIFLTTASDHEAMAMLCVRWREMKPGNLIEYMAELI